MSTDCFDPTAHHQSFKLSANNKIATLIGGGGFRTAHLSKKVNSGVHKWKFKILKNRWAGMSVGIWKSRNKSETNADLGIKGKSYSYWPTHASLSQGDAPDDSYVYSNESWHSRYHQGTVIEMILNCNAWSLSFTVNNKEFGVAFQIEKTSYNAAVFISEVGNAFELISYSNDDAVMNMNEDSKCDECEIFREKITKLKEENIVITNSLQERINDLEREKVRIQQKVQGLKAQNERIKNESERDKNERIKIVKKLKCQNVQKNVFINDIQQKMEEIKNEKIRMQQKYNEKIKMLQKENTKLNEQCKEMNIKYCKLRNKMKLDERNWREWDYSDIAQWIIHLNDQHKQFADTLYSKLKKEEVDGTMLPYLDKGDLHRFGIILMKHKLSILKHIKILTNKYQNQQQQFAQNDEGDITAFI